MRHLAPAVQMLSLGTAEISVGGDRVTKWGAGHACELMQYALLHPNQLLLRETLQEHFWPGSDPSSSSLRVAAHTVRRILEPVESVRLESRPAGYQLITSDPGAVLVDAKYFGNACLSGRRLLADGDVSGALAYFTEAMRWYQGDLLPECDRPWAAPLRECFRSWALDGLSHLYRDALARRDEEQLLRWSLATLQVDPYNERCYRSVVTVYGIRRNHMEVQRWVRACTSRLAEIGRFADPETVRIMRQTVPAVEAPRATPPGADSDTRLMVRAGRC